MKLGAEFVEGVRIAGGAIRGNKMRSVLATLGIVIGIVTVTLMGTAITGLNNAFLRSISSLGTDVLHVSRFSWFINSHKEWLKSQSRPEITLAQIRALEEQLTLARAVAPYTEWNTPVRYKNRSSRRVSAIGPVPVGHGSFRRPAGLRDRVRRGVEFVSHRIALGQDHPPWRVSV